MERREISWAQEFRIFCISTLPSRKWIIAPHTKYGLPVVISPKGYSVESGDSNFTMRKTDKHKSARWSQLTSTVGGLINCSLYMLDENGTLPLCVSSPRHITAV